MTTARSDLFSDSVVALSERKRMLDAVWLLSLGSVFVGLFIPWFFRVIEFDLAALGWSVFVYGAIYTAIAIITDRQRLGRAVLAGVGLKQISTVVFLAVMWHLAGGIDNPMFLLAFLLPVMISGQTMVGLRPLLVALLSALVVIAVALIESPGLRWYVSQAGIPVSWFSHWLPSDVPWRPTPFPGLRTSPAFQVMVLELFVTMLLAVALVSRPLATLVLRLYARLHTSAQSLRELQGLFQAVLHAQPEPGLIIYADTGQVVHASSSFFKRMLLTPEDVVGKGLFDLLDLDQAEGLRAALENDSGELPFCVYRVGPETRIANISFYRTEHQGTAYVYLGLHEVTELYYLSAAFNAISDPLVVVGIQKELLYANRAAQGLFGPLHFGTGVRSFIRLARLYDEWRGQGDHSARTYRTEVDFRPYEVSGVVARLQGEAGPCTILWLHGVEREEALFEEVILDPLTGLYNRRYFTDTLTRLVAGVMRGKQLACAYLDLDHFKAINDHLGHGGGDAALLAFVDALKSELRSTDMFARLGGDEFALALPDTEASSATVLLNRVYKRLADKPFEFRGESRVLSFSAGVANCHSGDSVDDLLDRADRALYRAKSEGRGKCVLEE